MLDNIQKEQICFVINIKKKKKIKKQDAYPHLAYKSTHPTKGDTAILHKNLSLHFCSITKNHLLSLFIAPEILKIQELTTKTILIPVRILYSFHVSFRFAPEWHLLSIAIYYTHITSPLPILCIYYTPKIMVRYFCT